MLTVWVRCSIRRCRAHGVGAVLVLQLDRSDQRADGYDQLLERAAWFYEEVSFSAAMKSQTPGAGQDYPARTPTRTGNGPKAATMTSCCFLSSFSKLFFDISTGSYMNHKALLPGAVKQSVTS